MKKDDKRIKFFSLVFFFSKAVERNALGQNSQSSKIFEFVFSPNMERELVKSRAKVADWPGSLNRTVFDENEVH